MKKIILTGLLCLLILKPVFSQEVGEGKISGYMFGDYFYNILRDSTINNLNNTGLTGIKDLEGFDIRRAYFTYDYRIDKQFSTRFRLEAQTLVSIQNTVFLTYLRDAYLKWRNIFKGSDFIFGIQPTPAFDAIEDYWNYRSIEKTIMDLRRIVSSRDLGASLKGRLNAKGTIKYWVMYGNGSALGAESDKFKRIYAQIDLAPSEEFNIAAYVDYRFKEDKEYVNIDQNFNNDALTTDLFFGYQQTNVFSVGVESFMQFNYNDAIEEEDKKYLIQNRNALGISVFGWYKFSELLVGLGRYDYYDPNISGDFRGDSRNLFITGLSFVVNDMVAITPNFLFETYEQPVDGRSIDPSLTGRITFYFKFL